MAVHAKIVAMTPPQPPPGVHFYWLPLAENMVGTMNTETHVNSYVFPSFIMAHDSILEIRKTQMLWQKIERERELRKLI